MPTLPASGYAVPVAPSVEPLAALPGGYQDIRAPVQAFGGATAEGLQAFGQGAAQAAEHVTNIQSFYDQIASDEKVNQVEDKINKKLYGDPSVPGDVGYLGLQGDQAMNSRDATRKAIDSILLEHRSAVGNLNQQHMFDQQTRRYRNTALQQVGQHYDREFNKWTTATYENKAKLGVAAGQRAANENNFELFNDAVNSTRNGLELSMRAAGKPVEEIENAKTEVTKHMAAGWARNRIVLDPAEAEKFIDAHKDVLGDQYDNLLKAARDKADELKVDDAISGKAPRQLPSNRIGTTGAAEHYNTAVSLGASPNEAVLLTSGADAESGFDPTKTHDGGIGYGLYGHNAERLAAMREQFGPNPTARQQIQFALNELRSRPEGALVNAAKTPEELTELQMQFERPTPGPTDQRARRLATTREYMLNPPKAGGAPAAGMPGGAVVEAQGGGVRNLPIATTVNAQLERAAAAVGDLKVEVFSGGQPSSGPNRTGSHRHDEGGAADIQLRDVKTGQLLDMRKPADQARMQKFITEAVAAGATGVGAAEDYMGPYGIHIGGGKAAAWGGDKTSATAPGWVRAAFEAGRAGAAPAARASAPAIASAAPAPPAPAPTTAPTVPAAPPAAAVTIPGSTPGLEWPISFTVTPGATSAPTAPGSGAIEVWGDSLGVGLKGQLKSEGTAVGGAQPAAILANIKAKPGGYWNGKTVVLSAGSNGNQMDKVEETVDHLQSKNATVVLVGYGPKFPEKNQKLRQIAQMYNAKVIDAEDAADGGKGVHPSPGGYASMASKIRALGSARPAGEGSGGGTPEQTALDAGEDTEATNLFYTEGSGGDTVTPPPASAGGDPPGFQRRWADVESRLPADRPDLIMKAKTKLHQQMNIEWAEQQHSRQIAEDQRKAANDGAENDLFSQIYPPDGTPSKVTPTAIANNPSLTPEGKTKMLSAFKSSLEAEPNAAQSRVTYANLYQRMILPYGNPEKITGVDPIDQALIRKQLTRADHDSLRKEFFADTSPTGMRLKDTKQTFIKGFEAIIDKSNPLMADIDREGKLNFSRFVFAVEKQVERMRNENKDPDQLFDENSSAYLGTPKFLNQFIKPLGESTKDLQKGMRANPDYRPPAIAGPATVAPGQPGSPAPVPPTAPNSPVFTAPIPGAVPPRQPGETPGAYEKRIGR